MSLPEMWVASGVVRQSHIQPVKGRLATDAEVGRWFRDKMLHHERKGVYEQKPTEPCCSSPVTQIWLGIEWIGKPWPKRLRLQSPIRVKRFRGCGCSKRLKDWTDKIKERFRGQAT